MLHLPNLSGAVKVVDGVADETKGEDTENAPENRRTDGNEFLCDQQDRCSDAEDDRAFPYVAEGELPRLFHLFEFFIAGHGRSVR